METKISNNGQTANTLFNEGKIIVLKSISLNNFKGIKNLKIDFNQLTTIYGTNATGKTTINDAFTWLLFGKDSHDVKDFGIKNWVDKNLNKTDHEVTGVLEVDGVEVILKRVYREKWVKKRGEPEPTFTGHETEYYYNGVPLAQKEYDAKVGDILNESIAKLITSPLYFNSMKWNERRAVLTNMAGEISDTEIAGNDKDFFNLLRQVTGKSLAEFKKEIAAGKKRIKTDMDDIPARIDELQRGMPESEDWELIENEIDFQQLSIEELDEAIENKSAAYQKEFDAINKKQAEKHELQMKLSRLENEAKQGSQKAIEGIENKIRTLSRKQESLIADLNFNTDAIKRHEGLVKKMESENAELRVSWNNRNAETAPKIDPKDITCPTCQRLFDAKNIETIKETALENFNKDKARRMKAISEKGQANKAEIERLQAVILSLANANLDIEAENTKNEVELDRLRFEKDSFTDIPHEDSKEITALKMRISTFAIVLAPVINTDDLKAEKAKLQSEIKDLERRLSVKETIERTQARIAELQAEEKTLAQKLADLEKTEFVLLNFEKAKIEAVEERVNDMFKIIKWKMFDIQINGGLEPTCIALIGGVPFADANTASKINGGIDCINALCNYYNIYAPIFIDNRESINDILPTKSQVINLVVSRDKKLVVS